MAAVVGKITSWFRFALSIAESRRSVSRVFLTSPGFVPTSPGLILPNQGTRRNSRRVVKRTTRSVRPGRRSESIMLKKPQSVWEVLFSRAYIYIYVFYFPEKVFTPSHGARFPLIFMGFQCEGFVFQAFTGAVNAGKSKPSRKKTAESQVVSGIKALRAVNT